MAIVANIYADQGSYFEANMNVTNSEGNVADLTGYTARAQARRTYSSSTSYDFVVTIPSPTTDGNVKFSMTGLYTGLMKGRYVYDVEIISPAGTVTRVIEGQMEVTPRVTRNG